MSVEYTSVAVEKRGPVQWVTLNRPQKRNAITMQMAREVNSAYRQAREDDEVRVVVLTGAGTVFCAGLDLKENWGIDGRRLREFVDVFYREMTDVVYSLGKPLIAAMNGPAIAAGNSFAFSCDMIIASDRARIGYTEIIRGLIPAMHLTLLPRIIGKHRAFELLFTGELISAQEAFEKGMINRVVPHDSLEEEVTNMALKLASNSPLVTRYQRDAFYRSMDMEFRKGIMDAADILCILADSEDTREGMKAFAEKREPVWKGR
jgi:enoyl-CoA hydratase/carnithine racemase